MAPHYSSHLLSILLISELGSNSHTDSVGIASSVSISTVCTTGVDVAADVGAIAVVMWSLSSDHALA
jgi:hypothetical protein